MKRWPNLTKMQKMGRIAWIYFAFIAISVLIMRDPDPDIIDSSTAQIICSNAYEHNAEYQADIGMFNVSTLIENRNTWKIVVHGELQNGFGAWRQVSASCVVYKKPQDPTNDFSYMNIKEFRYHL